MLTRLNLHASLFSRVVGACISLFAKDWYRTSILIFAIIMYYGSVFKCPSCNKSLRSEKGLRSHRLQSPSCSQYALEGSSESTGPAKFVFELPNSLLSSDRTKATRTCAANNGCEESLQQRRQADNIPNANLSTTANVHGLAKELYAAGESDFPMPEEESSNNHPEERSIAVNSLQASSRQALSCSSSSSSSSSSVSTVTLYPEVSEMNHSAEATNPAPDLYRMDGWTYNPPPLTEELIDEQLQGLHHTVRRQVKLAVMSEQRANGAHFIPNGDEVLLELMEMLDRASCPHYLFEEIVNWAMRSAPKTNNFDPRYIPARTRKSFVRILHRILGLSPNDDPGITYAIIARETDNHVSVALPYPAKEGKNCNSQTVHEEMQFPHPSWHRGVSNLVDLYDRRFLEGRATHPVVSFSFVRQLQDLLDTRSYFDDLSVLQVNPQCPWLPYRNAPLDKVDDVLSGKWYQRTISSLGLDDIRTKEEWRSRGKPFVIPIIMYVDKTGTDAMCRYPLEPLLFTIGLFRRNLRNMYMSWRHLGFVPDMDSSSSKAQRRADGGARNCRNYHKVLDVLLSQITSIHERKRGTGLQGHIPIPLRLTFESEEHLVQCYLPIAFVIGDNKSNDNLCAKVGGHHLSQTRVSRACDCSVADADGHRANCRFVDQEDIVCALERVSDARAVCRTMGETPLNKHRREAAEKLLKQDHHRYFCKNAFHDAWFGSSRGGIHTATPTDLLHTIRLGAMQRVVELLTTSLGNSGKAALDDSISNLFCKNRNTGRKAFPRIHYLGGISNLTMMQAKEWVGAALALLLFIGTEAGYETFLNRYVYLYPKIDKYIEDEQNNQQISSPQRKKPKQRSSSSKLQKIILDNLFLVGEETDSLELTYEERARLQILKTRLILEKLLMFDAWCSNGPFWHPLEAEEKQHCYEEKIGALINDLVRNFQRPDGNGWKLQKTHEMLHFPRFITEFGHPMNYDSGQGESALKQFAKHPAKNARKRNMQEFQEQVGRRCYENNLRGKVRQLVDSLENQEGSAITRVKQRCLDVLQPADFVPFDSSEELVTNTELGHESGGSSRSFLYNNVRTTLRLKYWSIKVFQDPTQRRKNLRIRFLPPRKKTAEAMVHPTMLSTIANFLHDKGFPTKLASSVSIDVFSEAVRNRLVINTGVWKQQMMIRSHADYQGNGAWHDWVMTNWDEGCGYYPAKVLALFTINISIEEKLSLPESARAYTDKPLFLFHCTTDFPQSRYLHGDRESKLTKKYLLEFFNASKKPLFRIEPMDIIEKQCFAFQHCPGIHERVGKFEDQVVTLVHDRRTEWGDFF